MLPLNGRDFPLESLFYQGKVHKVNSTFHRLNYEIIIFLQVVCSRLKSAIISVFGSLFKVSFSLTQALQTESSLRGKPLKASKFSCITRWLLLYVELRIACYKYLGSFFM